MDAWDAVKNNEFFSPEAWIFAFSQMFQVPDRCFSGCLPSHSRSNRVLTSAHGSKCQPATATTSANDTIAAVRAGCCSCIAA